MSNWRSSREYRIWRAGVIRRDSVCKICSERQGRHAHHLNHATYFVEERYNVKNGVCLCAKCHSIFHNDYKSSTREKCTEKDYNEFNKIIDYYSEKAMEFAFKKIEEDRAKEEANEKATEEHFIVTHLQNAIKNIQANNLQGAVNYIGAVIQQFSKK